METCSGGFALFPLELIRLRLWCFVTICSGVGGWYRYTPYPLAAALLYVLLRVPVLFLMQSLFAFGPASGYQSDKWVAFSTRDYESDHFRASVIYIIF